MLDRDGCRLSKGMDFRFRAPSGRHRLRIGLDPVVPSVRVTVTGGKAGPAVSEVRKKDPPVELDLETGDDLVTIASDSYADLLWVTLIEKEP